MRVYDGDLDDYRKLLLETSGDAAPVSAADRPRGDRLGPNERRALLAPLRQRSKASEREVAKLDAERAQIEASLADPASYGDGQDIAKLQKRLAELQRLTEAAEARWLEAEAEIERLSAA